MAGLRAKVVKETFQSLLRLNNDDGLVGDFLYQVEDGDGVDTGMLISNDRIGVDRIQEKTPNAGVTIEGVVIKDNVVTTDTINEQTENEGVTIEGVAIENSAVVASGGFTGALTGTASLATLAVTAGVATALQTARTIGGVSFNGVSNIVPDTITIADEDSDTTCFPLFVTAATGDLAPKSNSDKLSFNAGSGVLTASGFAGPLTGNVTGNLTGTLQTAAQPNVTSLGALINLTVDNIILDTSTMTITHGEGDYSTLTTIANGVTTLSSFDHLTGTDADINVIADGDIYLRPKPGGGVHLYDSDDSTYVPSHDRHAINKAYADTYYRPMYTYFAWDSVNSGSMTAGPHYTIPCAGSGGRLQALFSLGSALNPAAVWDISANNNADDLIHTMWYVPDAITILSAEYFLGADTATPDVTRCHLMSYAISKGDNTHVTNGDLSDGTVVADGADVTTLGYENVGYRTMGFGAGAGVVPAGRALFFTLQTDTVNSDYAIKVIIKYKLT